MNQLCAAAQRGLCPGCGGRRAAALHQHPGQLYDQRGAQEPPHQVHHAAGGGADRRPAMPPDPEGVLRGIYSFARGKRATRTEQLPRAKIPYVETGIEIKHTICDICAPGNHCRVNACVKDGKLMKVEGDPEHPFNHGILCTKGSANSQYVYRKERLFAPMKWTGPGAAISSSPLHGRRPTGPSRRILIASRRSRDRRAWLSIPATGSGTGSL